MTMDKPIEINEGEKSPTQQMDFNNSKDENIIEKNIPKKKKRSTVIVGDSMLKDIQQHKIRNGLTNNEKVYVKHFAGATVEHMKSYCTHKKI